MQVSKLSVLVSEQKVKDIINHNPRAHMEVKTEDGRIYMKLKTSPPWSIEKIKRIKICHKDTSLRLHAFIKEQLVGSFIPTVCH